MSMNCLEVLKDEVTTFCAEQPTSFDTEFLRGISIPSNVSEMALICAEVDNRLHEAVTDKELDKKIKQFRKSCFRVLVKTSDNWQKVNWKDETEALETFRKVASIRLNLPDKAPNKDSKEWTEQRSALLKVSYAVIAEWGLDGMRGNGYKIDDFIIRIWADDYNISKQDLQKKLIWEGKDEATTKKNVQRNLALILTPALALPSTIPTKGSPDWQKARSAILDVRPSRFRGLGLAYLESQNYADLEYPFRQALADLWGEVYDFTDADFVPERRTWQGESDEETFDNIQAAVLATAISELKIPEIAPAKYSSEWHDVREIILGINLQTLEDLRLKSPITTNGLDYREIVSNLWGEAYDFTIDDLRKKFTWQSKEILQSDVRRLIVAACDIDLQAEVGSHGWEDGRLTVLSLNSPFLVDLGLRSAFGKKSKWFKDGYADLLSACFPEYELRAYEFTSFGAYLRRNKVYIESLSSLDIVFNDQFDVDALPEDQERFILDFAVQNLLSHDRVYDEAKSEHLHYFVGRSMALGDHIQRYSLEKLWKITASYIEKIKRDSAGVDFTLFVLPLSRRLISMDSSSASGGSIEAVLRPADDQVESALNLIALQEAFRALSAREQFLLSEFIAGKIESSSEVELIVEKIRSFLDV